MAKTYSANPNDYKLLEEVGFGASATVYRAIYLPYNEVVAVKCLDLDRCHSNLDDIRREAQTMSLIDHPNVIKAFCSFVVDRNLWVVMPFMAEGSCLHLMKIAYQEGFEESAIGSILKETLKALEYLHHHGHIHRDVKAGNILIDSDGEVKLADFGVSACMFDRGDRQRSRNTFVGTPCWMAPEVLQPGTGYDFKADIWSFGITALELAHGHAPFSKYPPMKVLLMTIQNAPPGLDYDRDKRFSKSFKEMVAMCLVKDQTKRPTAEKLLKHSFFKNAKPPELSVKKLFVDLPPLWKRVKDLRLKDDAQLALKKMPSAEQEAISQEWYAEDSKALANQIKEHESTLRLKRRWLMDLPLSEKEQKRIEDLLPPNDKIMPESFVRKDDVGYEDIKTCIEMAFRVHKSWEKLVCVHDDVTSLNLCGDFQKISFLLDAMNNKGLCSFARILIGGLIIFEKTNLSMKRTIRELLPKVIAEKNDISKSKLTECSLLLKDPTIFHENQMVHFTASESYHAAALKVLDGLEDFPSSTLRAMNRKLKGVKVYIPPLQPPKSGRNRGNLVNVVRKRCMEMLSCIGTVDEPAEQLARALGVAGLTLKLLMNRPDVRNFRIFSPEIEALHNDIAKAIHLLNEPKKVSMIELNKVQLLLDSKASVRGLRTAVRNLLIEYLYECSDMDSIPDFLIETIDIINRRAQLRSCKKSSSSNGFSSPEELMKEDIEKETQHVLNISAQAREVVANLLPEHEFDEEFANAYMEDFDGRDTLCVFDVDREMEDGCQHFEFRSYTSYDQTESIGEINPVEFNSPLSSKRDGCLNVFSKGRSDMDMESMHLSPVLNNQRLGKEYPPGRRVEELGLAYSHSIKAMAKPSMSPPSHSPARKSCHNGLESEEPTSCFSATTKYGLSDFKVEEADIVHQQSRSVNQYLALQDACDITSMAAYRFVGYMLDTLAKTEGLELYQGDRLYLKSYTSVPEDTEESSDTLASKFSEMWKIVLEH